MAEIPEDVAALVAERDEARAAKDYTRSDELRDRIETLGFTVRDTPAGGVAEPKPAAPAYEVLEPHAVADTTGEPAACAVSIHVLSEGFAGDLTRFVDSLRAQCGSYDYEIVVSECGGADADAVESVLTERVRALHFAGDPGWAASRNAALGTSRGRVLAVADLSVEATGDLLGPLLAAFEDPSVGVAGPWGLSTADLRTFEESAGPEVDAVQGYFLATRRELFAKARFDEKLKWYRHADIDFSFQVRALGYRAVATAPEARRHAHRAWEALDEAERDKRSKRNFYRFLERFKDRTDLSSAREGSPDRPKGP